MVFEFQSTKQNNVNVYKLSGELIDKNQSKEMLQEIEEGITKGETKIVFNFEGLKYMNSSGLNIIISLLTKTRSNGGNLNICCVNKKIIELLNITKLNTIFTITDTEDAAIALFA